MKFGTGKQAQAITVNQKEDRILEKTDSTLKLEKEYAMKLIELNCREVKIHQRRLKAKVSKIKSHLSVEEIKDFREQEHEGRFGPTINTVSVSGAFTISAAARRLKLCKERRMAAHGCLPDGSKAMTSRQYQRQQSDRLSKSVPAKSRHSSQYTETPPATPATPATPGATSVRMSFHFRDAESTVGAEELFTITETPKTPKSARSAPGGVSNTPRDVTDGEIKVSLKARPSTSVGPRREKVKHPPRCKSSSGYSSHAAIEKDARDRERFEAGRRMTRSQSLLSNSSIDGDLAKGRLEERRQTLLDLEQLQTMRLVDRKQDFLNRVNKWVKENPSTNKEDPQMSKLMSVLGQEPATGAAVSKAGGAKGSDKTDKRKKPLPRASSFHGNIGYKQRQDKPVEVHWKDLNKCRYLRISEDEIDLSGVVTLAKDQLSMYAALRQPDEGGEEN